MFQVGDIVQLKSGGPTMTVEYAGNRADGPFMVLCTWFDDRGQVKRKAFTPENLKTMSAESDSY